jgi:polyhydroxyalkanoate synthase
MADAGLGDLLGGIRREVERNAFRARNGIKYVAGSEWAPRGPTPSEVVWRLDKVHVRRYRRTDAAGFATPVLAFLGLVSRSYIFDLWRGNSFAQRLMDAGFDVFVLDWGEPDAADARNTIDTYLQRYLPRAIDAVRGATAAEQVSVIGYCMGGDLALLGLATDPGLPIRNLVTMATPVDFSQIPRLVLDVSERVNADSVIDESGLVPASVVDGLFRVRRPTADLVQYANLWQNLWNDEFMEGYQAMGRWLREPVPIAGAAFRQLAGEWVRGNGFVNGTLHVGGRRADFASLRLPVLAVIATKDDIVPEAAASPIADLLPNAELELVRLDAGHASLTVGRIASKVAMPVIASWLAARSEEAG